MRYSNAVIAGLAASTAVSATPVDSSEMIKRGKSVDGVINDVTHLLEVVVKDASVIFDAAGVNGTEKIEQLLAPLAVAKRDNVELDERGVANILAAVANLVKDILYNVGRITSIGTIFGW